MNLLTYAVSKKLEQPEDSLLEYIAKGRDVPLEVLEESFGGLIQPLKSEKSELLVEDYLKMLDKYVPMQYTGNQSDGSYRVTGEVSESLLETIELVHNKSQEDIISEMVSEGTRKITNRPVDVGEISLTELMAQVEDITDNMTSVQTLSDGECLDEDILDEDILDEDILDEDILDSLIPDVSSEIKSDDAIEEVESEEVIEEVDSKEVMEEVESKEVIEEPEPKEVIEEPEPKEVIEESEEEVIEEPEPKEVIEEPEEEVDEDQLMIEGIRRVYTKLVNDLKAFGLDKSLGLSI